MIKEKVSNIPRAVFLALFSMGHFTGSVGAQLNTPNVITTEAGESSRLNLEDNLEQIKRVTEERRELHRVLTSLADTNYMAAEVMATDLRDYVIGELALAEWFKQGLPDSAEIRVMNKSSLEYRLCRAVAGMRNSALSLDSLIRQVLQSSPHKPSGIDPEAIKHLAVTGTNAANHWL